MEKGLGFLSDLGWGYRAARALQTAVMIDLFTNLAAGGMSLEEICQKCRTKAALTEKLLIACCALGLLERHEGKYNNTPLASEYLVRGTEFYQGDIIAHSAVVWDTWDKLPEDIRAEQEPVNEHKDFIFGMHNVAVAGRVQLFLEHVDLAGRKKLFDAGGGPGTYSIEACRKYPELEATVFDLPETIAIAKGFVESSGVGDRITLQEGDWDADDFGDGNDVVLLSDVMHGPESGADMLLGKAFESMSSGGLLVVQEFLLNDEKSGPVTSSLFNIMVGAFSVEELFIEIEKSGFIQPWLVAENEQIGSSWLTAVKP
jgi:hypothetical protein